jgi:hypothetical protein
MGGICMDAPAREISMGISRQLAVMAALAAFSGGAAAVGTIAEVSIYDRAENRVLPVYRHQGRHYVVGKPGNEYQVRVHNRDGGEVLAVIAVDGADRLRAGFAPELRRQGLAQEHGAHRRVFLH